MYHEGLSSLRRKQPVSYTHLFGLPEYYEDQDKMDPLFARQGELQYIIDATDAWKLDSKLERAMDALDVYKRQFPFRVRHILSRCLPVGE